jgi:hypothetical protein
MSTGEERKSGWKESCRSASGKQASCRQTPDVAREIGDGSLLSSDAKTGRPARADPCLGSIQVEITRGRGEVRPRIIGRAPLAAHGRVHRIPEIPPASLTRFRASAPAFDGFARPTRRALIRARAFARDTAPLTGTETARALFSLAALARRAMSRFHLRAAMTARLRSWSASFGA